MLWSWRVENPVAGRRAAPPAPLVHRLNYKEALDAVGQAVALGSIVDICISAPGSLMCHWEPRAVVEQKAACRLVALRLLQPAFCFSPPVTALRSEKSAIHTPTCLVTNRGTTRAAIGLTKLP